MDEYEGMKVNEKQIALENIVELTLDGVIVWEKEAGLIKADYVSKLKNHIEVDSFSVADGRIMTKVTISNEYGKMILNNGDMTENTHRRLLNAINLQLKETNVLIDFV